MYVFVVSFYLYIKYNLVYYSTHCLKYSFIDSGQIFTFYIPLESHRSWLSNDISNIRIRPLSTEIRLSLPAGPVSDWSLLVRDWSGLLCSPGPVRTEDRTAVLLGPTRTAVPVPVLVIRGGPVRSSVLSPRKFSLRTGTGPDPATLAPRLRL